MSIPALAETLCYYAAMALLPLSLVCALALLLLPLLDTDRRLGGGRGRRGDGHAP